MLKVFLSQPMMGKTNDEIIEVRNRIFSALPDILGDAVREIPSFLPKMNKNRNDVFMLGKSIELMSDAVIVVFAPDYDKARGCNVEHLVCEMYKIKYVCLYDDGVSLYPIFGNKS